MDSPTLAQVRVYPNNLEDLESIRKETKFKKTTIALLANEAMEAGMQAVREKYLETKPKSK